MARITVNVHAEDDWRVTAVPALDAIAVTYHCPRCGNAVEIRLQPGPWSHPADVTGHEKFAGENGNLHPGFADYEKARTAGELAHTDDAQLETQLWCHRCMVGADVTVNT